ncbi:MAG: DEAD/DEAH box helicase, partial [Rhodocyclaceae bacterium]|nr:DEAD/DEAH box helicase [Rhodocyclaceae bacterium]
RALILCPTRELALQVHESVCTYGRHIALRSTCIYGGVDMDAQTKQLREGREIVVATPGRLLDHVQQKTVLLNQVQILVLDEADRMLDMGFIPDVKRILNLLPAQRQSLMFSATFSEDIKKLAETILRDPQLIEVARRNATAETVAHQLYAVAADDKRVLLRHLLTLPENETRQALVFVNTKFGCSRLAVYLAREGVAADAIHGDKNQQQRTEALDAFKAGKVRVLVATDVAARGLDIEDLPFVVNFELPPNAEDYVHRIGRTGRAGKSGEAISFMAPEESYRLAEIEKLIKRQIERKSLPAYTSGAGRDERHRHHVEREARRHPGPSHSRGTQNVAADGFDFNKPYEPRGDAEPPAPDAPPGRAAPRRPAREVAFLLGGGKRS